MKGFYLLSLLIGIGSCILGSYDPSFPDVLGQPTQQQQNQQVTLPQQQPAVKITSPTIGQAIPTGQLTISGTSSDTVTSDCQVYADLNDQKPFHKAVASGPGGIEDYSKWTFTYNSIKNGTNNLTSKISCIDSISPTSNLTKWYSVNVTGMDGMIPQRINQQQQQPPSFTNGTSTVSLSSLGTLEIDQSLQQSVPTPVPPLDPGVGDKDEDEDTDDEQDSDDENDGDQNDDGDGDDGSRDEEDEDEDEETGDRSDANTDEDEDEQRSQNRGGDGCGIGDRGFPFCDDEGEEESNEDGDGCGIGDRGFPFCDGRPD